MDFDSLSAAQTQYDLVAAEVLPSMDTAAGGRPAGAEPNGQGLGSMLVFIHGDAVVSLHTVQIGGHPPLVTLSGLEGLGKLISDRLGTDN